MKKFLLFWLMGYLPLVSAAQTDGAHPQKIRKALLAYFDAVTAKDWPKVLDYMPPQVFELTPREQVLKSLQDASNQFVDFQTHQPTSVRVFDRVFSNDTARFYLIGYQKNVTWIFRPKPGETDASFQGRMDYTFFRLKKRYGIEHVTRGASPSVFHLRIPSYMVAIENKNTGKIYLVEYIKDMKRQTALQKIIGPEAVNFFNNIIFGHTQ